MLTYIYSHVRIQVAVQFARDKIHITSVNFIKLMDVVDCLSRHVGHASASAYLIEIYNRALDTERILLVHQSKESGVVYYVLRDQSLGGNTHLLSIGWATLSDH